MSYLINAPYNGGTHIPDLTVCTPIFDKAKRKILFWVASRGHHADIGGIAPGSMSPIATNIEEEGIYIDNFKLVDRGKFREAALYDLLTKAKYPARNPLQNVNDLKAQIAANEKGVQELHKMVGLFGLNVVHAYMKHVQDNADESVRRVIEKLHDSEFSYEADQGNVVKVKITVDKKKREATVDFTGTSPQQGTNFNAPEPVTRAAVLYVFRVMVDDDIPMNAGCLRPINIVIPDNSMLRPHYPAAVVAGNVEVSQMVTDTLLGRARRHGRRAGHHEQRQLRQRHLSVLRDDLLGLAGGPGLPRHRRRAHPHDQHPADRSGDSGVPLSGGAGGLPHPQRLRRQGPMECRRRHPPHHAVPGEDGIHRSCPAIAASDRSAWPAARTARSARTGSGGTTARWSGSRAPTPPWSTPAKRSSSRRRPPAGMARHKGSGAILCRNKSSNPTSPRPAAPFNLCVRHGNMIYVSGLPPFDAEFSAQLRNARANKQPIPAFPDIPFERQVRIVMDHLKKLVEAAGSNMDCLLKVIVWLKDQRQQEEFDRIYRSYFSSQETLPARTRMQAGRTPLDCGLEVEAIGYVP